jgi:hypothetical protein
MLKNASHGEPLEAPAPAAKRQAEPWAGISMSDIVSIRKFQVNDVVRIIAEGQKEYIVLFHRDYEPCCQIQRNDDLQRREWMISEELELVAGLADDPHGPSEADTSATGLPRTRIS